MITFLTFLFTAILLLITNEWITSLLTPNNLADIGVVILGMIALSASLQIRTLFEKTQDILRLYAQYTNPNSEEGSKLSPQEKERLLDLFLHELWIVIDQFGGRWLVRIGGFTRKVLSYQSTYLIYPFQNFPYISPSKRSIFSFISCSKFVPSNPIFLK